MSELLQGGEVPFFILGILAGSVLTFFVVMIVDRTTRDRRDESSETTKPDFEVVEKKSPTTEDVYYVIREGGREHYIWSQERAEGIREFRWPRTAEGASKYQSILEATEVINDLQTRRKRRNYEKVVAWVK